MASINMNVIAVGSELFDRFDWLDILAAIEQTRGLYARVGLSIDRVEFYGIPLAMSRGREYIDDRGEAETLTDEWTVPNHALDVFFVRTFAGDPMGRSATDGPCDKNAKGMDGSVVAIDDNVFLVGVITAHEMAHYLGLPHVDDSNNLMYFSAPNGMQLTAEQGDNMRDHCFVF